MSRKDENPLLLALLGVVGFVLPKMVSPPKRRPAPAGKARADSHSPPIADGQPGALPALGWWGFTKRVGAEISDNQLMTQAAAITFYALLSIFPALAALVSIYGLVADPTTIVHQVDALSAVLPGGGQEILMDELKTLTTGTGTGLTWALIFGIATSLWTSNQAMKAMFNALNAVHDIKERRSFLKLTAITLVTTLGVLVFMVVALTAVVVVPAVLGTVGLGFVGELINWLRWPLLLVCISLLLAVLFRYGPCRSHVVWRWISGGSAFAAVGWLLVSVLFSWYVANFGNYNKTYGSLGAVVGFMTWIWISSTVVLIGAQVDAELEKSTAGPQRSRAASDQKPVTKSAASPG